MIIYDFVFDEDDNVLYPNYNAYLILSVDQYPLFTFDEDVFWLSYCGFGTYEEVW